MLLNDNRNKSLDFENRSLCIDLFIGKSIDYKQL